MKKSFIIKALVVVIIIITAQFCADDSLTGTKIENSSPDTYLFLYPDSNISQQSSQLQVHWWGDDPDGLIIGYYFKWEGISDSWTFTTKNDSLFSLPIGTADTTFSFSVCAVDNEGNGVYDNSIVQNGIDFGPEPFIDSDGNGVYTEGETYYDIGTIDPTPAERGFPIKNTPPIVEWNEASTLPAESYPVMTIGWSATDTDGDESITEFELALNDTSEFVTISSATSLVTLRIVDMDADEPEMEVLLNASEDDILGEHLMNLKLNADNRIYLRAKDISGGISDFITLPDTSSSWYVKKPKGKLVIVDNNNGDGDATAATFYKNMFNSLEDGALVDKYEVFDMENTQLPYSSITFYETLKLFDYVFWYSDYSPDLTSASLVTNKYIENGGKIMFSMTFQSADANFAFDLATIQNFLPVDSLGQDEPDDVLRPNADVLPSNSDNGYPKLKTVGYIAFPRTYYPLFTATETYDLSSSSLNGNIAFMNNTKSLFFIGLPLESANGIDGSVKQLLEKIFFEEFGFSL